MVLLYHNYIYTFCYCIYIFVLNIYIYIYFLLIYIYLYFTALGRMLEKPVLKTCLLLEKLQCQPLSMKSGSWFLKGKSGVWRHLPPGHLGFHCILVLGRHRSRTRMHWPLAAGFRGVSHSKSFRFTLALALSDTQRLSNGQKPVTGLACKMLCSWQSNGHGRSLRKAISSNEGKSEDDLQRCCTFRRGLCQSPFAVYTYKLSWNFIFVAWLHVGLWALRTIALHCMKGAGTTVSDRGGKKKLHGTWDVPVCHLCAVGGAYTLYISGIIFGLMCHVTVLHLYAILAWTPIDFVTDHNQFETGFAPRLDHL